MVIATVCEILMVICFGASWPFNIVKAYKSKTTKGTSILFMSLIEIGYTAGILCKVFTIVFGGGLTWLGYVAFAFYILNFIMVGIGISLYFRNKKYESTYMQG